MEEIHDLGDLIAKHKSQCRYFEEETSRNNGKKTEYENLSKKYIERSKQSEEELKRLGKELEEVQEAEITVDCRIEMEAYDIQLLKTQLKDLEEREKEVQDECRRGAKRSEEVRSRQIGDWQSRMNQNQRESAMKLLQQRSELGSKQKELERWEQKAYQKKEELSDLKAQMKDIRENQTRLAKLKEQHFALEKQQG